MGMRKQDISFQSFIVISILTYNLLTYELTHGRRITTKKPAQPIEHKGTIKTIVSDDGEIIDCVDIYKQPAFDHPLLKNHTIEEIPVAVFRGYKDETFHPTINQNWHKDGECPEGTVPIVRTLESLPTRSYQFFPYNKQLSQTILYDNSGHEYAQVSLSGGHYYGAEARINLWQPNVADAREFSIAQIWVSAGLPEHLNTVEAGWGVNLYGKKEPTLFTFWTGNGYENSGCYNLECPGFVQTNRKIALGATLGPTSIYDSLQYYIYINVFQNTSSTNWWLQFNHEILGYWPGKLYDKLVNGADRISWGGEIINAKSGGQHTSTQMGSGHFASEGYHKSAFFGNIGYRDGQSNPPKDPENLIPYASNGNCYDVLLGKDDQLKTHFFFGGPGHSDICP